MKIALLAAAMVVSTTSFAQGADVVLPAPFEMADDAAYDWSGFYAGIFAGGAKGVGTTRSRVFNTVTEPDVSGAMFGVNAGANVQFGKFVLGAEGDVAWAEMSGTTSCPAAGFSCGTSVDWLSTVRGRAGVAVDKALFFATGGIAAVGVTSVAGPFTDHDTAWGWTAGVGAELAVTEKVSLKAEYQYVDASVSLPSSGSVTFPQVDVNPQLHILKAGLNFRF